MKWVIPVLASILILGGMGLTQPTFAQIPPGFVDFNGHCYAKTAASSWETTELEAVSFGGHLVTINDLAENDFVFALNGGTGGTGGSGGTGAWIGYNDVAVEGTFEWVSGIVTGTPGYENWGVGEPNAFTGEDAAVMLGDGSWNDLTNFSSVVGIMELDTTCATAFASEHFILDDFTVPVAGESFLASTVGVFTAFTDTDVNTSLPFVLNRNTEVDLFSSSPMQIELNVASNGLLRAVTFNSPGTYELLLDYTSTTSLDITPVLSYEFLFTSNNDASLLAGIDAIDINGNTLTCTDKSVPVSTLPFTVSFDLGTDCSAPVLDPAQVDTLSFFMFNSNTQGVFEVDAIQSTLSATVPDAPTGLTATTGPASEEVTLSWTAPLNDGGSPITDYRVNFVLTGETIFSEFIHTPSTATSIVVTGLTPETVYDFHVHAINLVGDSLPSAIATATAGGASAFSGPIITEIIDSTGDGLGNTLVSAFAIDTDSSGNVFVTGNAGDNAFKIATDGTITEIIDATGGGLGILDEPFDLATDSLGNVYVSSLNFGNVFKIDTPGTCSTTTVPPCVITRIVAGGAGVISGALGVATDSLDNVFVGAFFTDNVIKIAPDGTITEIMDSSGDGTNSLIDPRRIATDSAGNVYVPGQTSNNVFKIDTPGTCSTTGTPCTITQIIDGTGDSVNTFSSPNKVATDSLGNVFVTGNISDNAFKIAPDGTITQIIDATGDGLGNTLDGTNGIATDSSGIVYVTGAGSANAFAIAPDGFIFEIIDGTGDGVNSLVNAGGIATDSFGHVFVVGVTSGNVFEIDFFGDSAIGGTLISIDTVALLLAGVQSISMWMIPVVVAGVVIGVFVIKRRK